MNKFFAIFLFMIGIFLILIGACSNLILIEFIPVITPLNSWGIIWRIGLGILLIIIAIILNNISSFSKSDMEDF